MKTKDVLFSVIAVVALSLALVATFVSFGSEATIEETLDKGHIHQKTGDGADQDLSSPPGASSPSLSGRSKSAAAPRWKKASMNLLRRRLQGQLLNESPLTRLLWKSWEAQTDQSAVVQSSAGEMQGPLHPKDSPKRRRQKKKRKQQQQQQHAHGLLPGFWFRPDQDQPDTEPGLSQQGMEPLKSGNSDEHVEEIGDLDSPGLVPGETVEEAGRVNLGPGGGAGAAKQFVPKVTVGEQDSPLVHSLRQQEESVKDLEHFPGIDTKMHIVRQYSVLADSYLGPWKAIPGIEAGMGSSGMISSSLLKAMGRRQFILACSSHIRIIDGTIYFRYGRFRFTWYRMMRLLITIKMLEDAVRIYKLRKLKAEFFLNTCDLPMSFDSSMGRERGGYPVFSTEWVKGSIDILYPDPLDLSEQYFSKDKGQIPWVQKVPRAFFRGATTNYILRNDTNWRASPRLRLHRMSEVRPDLLDAQVMRWSHADDKSTKRGIEEDGVRLGRRVPSEHSALYKYNLVVDGGGGSCRTCAALLGDQLMIRQSSSFQQFYQPLLRPFVHYIPTQHYFGDLYQQIEWARTHDTQCHHMVDAANRLAKWACTWRGRTLYWAVLLVKYSRNALADPDQVEHPAPSELCEHLAHVDMLLPTKKQSKVISPPENWPPDCGTPEASSVQQPECMYYCNGNTLPDIEVWSTSKAVQNIPRIPIELIKRPTQ